MSRMFNAAAETKPSLALRTRRRAIGNDLIDHRGSDVVLVDSGLQRILLIVAALFADAGQIECGSLPFLGLYPSRPMQT